MWHSELRLLQLSTYGKNILQSITEKVAHVFTRDSETEPSYDIYLVASTKGNFDNGFLAATGANLEAQHPGEVIRIKSWDDFGGEIESQIARHGGMPPANSILSAHGLNGQLTVGEETLTAENVRSTLGPQVQGILGPEVEGLPGTTLHLNGCTVAGGEVGHNFLEELAGTTGMDVHASPLLQKVNIPAFILDLGEFDGKQVIFEISKDHPQGAMSAIGDSTGFKPLDYLMATVFHFKKNALEHIDDRWVSNSFSIDEGVVAAYLRMALLNNRDLDVPLHDIWEFSESFARGDPIDVESPMYHAFHNAGYLLPIEEEFGSSGSYELRGPDIFVRHTDKGTLEVEVDPQMSTIDVFGKEMPNPKEYFRDQMERLSDNAFMQAVTKKYSTFDSDKGGHLTWKEIDGKDDVMMSRYTFDHADLDSSGGLNAAELNAYQSLDWATSV